MIAKKGLKIDLKKAIFGCFFAVMSVVAGLMVPIVNSANVFADPEIVEDGGEGADVEHGSGEDGDDEDAKKEEEGNVTKLTNATGDQCQESLGSIGWLVCPVTDKVAEAVDWLYGKLQDILLVKPVEAKDGSPIYEIWKIFLGFTNIVFIIFLLVVIYSQITGVGISNYGIKKVLPKLIITAVLVNLSFLICSLAVDVSNIVGNGLRDVFTNIEEAVMASSGIGASDVATAGGDLTREAKLSYANMYGALAAGAGVTVGGVVIAFETGAIWMLIPVLLGAIVSVVSGLITIALRQAVVALLIMIAPLAIVAYMLPNTEQWFKKWRQLLMKMLVFYPMFSLLFGASSLAGFAIIASAKDGFGLLLGTAVQIFPLFFSWSLMKMSGTILGTINAKMHGLAAGPLATNKAWAESHRLSAKQRHLASGNPTTPSLRLMQFMSNRKIAREAEIAETSEIIKNRALAYSAAKRYDKDGKPTKEAEKAYEMQARNMGYQQIILRDKNNMNKGLGQLVAVKKNSGVAQRARLNALDAANVVASDVLKAEQARGEKIDYENAMGFHKRMEDAVNAHFDEKYGDLRDDKTGKLIYKRHFDGNFKQESEAAVRYKAIADVMEGSKLDVQYVAATAAQGYDTQKKILETKMQKYFELTPPTKDVEYRLDELTRSKDAVANIDSIIPGLRVLNQRGDTDLVKRQLDHLLDKNIAGGIELGTHASQSLASFLMFEVKDNDPFLRRFGKYINLETARVYNSNDRKVMNVTYDEYVKGYHDGEDGLVSGDNPTGRMYAKKGMRQLVEGTSLDNIERTAFSNLDESLKKAYGFDKDHPKKTWDVAGWMRKREEIQTAFEPAFLSSGLKWLSGSEQMNSAVKFWTGYELKQKKENGRIMVDENGNPVYEWLPVWDSEEFVGHEKEVREYYQRKTGDYFKDQTTGQILGLRTDFREPAVEHLLEMYLSEDSEGEAMGERRRKYEQAKAEIQTRYGDEDAKVAKKKRDRDLTKLKRKLAGKQVKKILDATGKLEQIYTVRRSGTANNTKDWWREMLGLDDKEEIYRYLSSKDVHRKKKKRDEEDSSGDSPSGTVSPYSDVGFRTRVMTELNDMFDRTGDSADPDDAFYQQSLEKIEKEFGAESEVVGRYKDYKKNNQRASRGELWDKLEEILNNFFIDNDED